MTQTEENTSVFYLPSAVFILFPDNKNTIMKVKKWYQELWEVQYEEVLSYEEIIIKMGVMVPFW